MDNTIIIASIAVFGFLFISLIMTIIVIQNKTQQYVPSQQNPVVQPQVIEKQVPVVVQPIIMDSPYSQPAYHPIQHYPSQPQLQIKTPQQKPIDVQPANQEIKPSSNKPVIQETKPLTPIGPQTNQEIKPMVTQEKVQIETQPIIQSNDNIWTMEHNRIRADVGQKPVKWNSTIAQGAQDYANKCKMQHSANDDRKLGSVLLGENLSFGSPFTSYDDKRMMGLWESEKQYYKHPQYPSKGTGGETGHYTQIINKNVTEIGCGCANCNNSKMCVCRYNPIQNGSQYPY